jgi:putative chitinase
MTKPIITAKQLAAMGAGPEWLDPLNEAFARFAINTPARIAGFMGQAMHETGGLRTLTENLNYRMEALVRTWPSRFKSLDAAAPFHRQPEKIANMVYANRMGNGAPETGEGWKYRGRGIFQLTGKANYEAAGKALGVDLVNDPDQVAQPRMAALTAGWYWDQNKMNELADKGDTAAMGRVVNMGPATRTQTAKTPHGAEDRTARTTLALAAMKPVKGAGGTDTHTA